MTNFLGPNLGFQAVFHILTRIEKEVHIHQDIYDVRDLTGKLSFWFTKRQKKTSEFCIQNQVHFFFLQTFLQARYAYTRVQLLALRICIQHDFFFPSSHLSPDNNCFEKTLHTEQ